MKWVCALGVQRVMKSLPVRGAWVEMREPVGFQIKQGCRSPCGERGLKCWKRRLWKCRSYVAPRAGSVG